MSNVNETNTQPTNSSVQKGPQQNNNQKPPKENNVYIYYGRLGDQCHFRLDNGKAAKHNEAIELIPAEFKRYKLLRDMLAAGKKGDLKSDRLILAKDPEKALKETEENRLREIEDRRKKKEDVNNGSKSSKFN